MKKLMLFCLALIVAWPLTAQTGRTKSTISVKESEVNRDFELEKAVQDRSRRLSALMQAEAKAKLDLATRAVLTDLAASPGNSDPHTVARREVRGRFPRLSSDQADLFTFYVLAAAADRISSGEIRALRLQNDMDRKSKFIQSLSNIMKKISATQDTIVQNIK